jgi:hypothetical protein
MRALAFVREGLSVNLLVTDRVDDILPKLREAMRPVSDVEKEMKTATAEQM